MDLSETYDAVPSIIAKVVVHYSGSNDEGYVGEIEFEPHAPGLDLVLSDEVEEMLRNSAYDILEDHFPGWEINEGSEGTITFDILKRTTSLHHGEIVESFNWHDVVI